MADPRLPQNVITLEDAVDTVENNTVVETLELAMENGYFLADINEDKIFNVEYKLLKLEK